jgi:tetratricopeptide (TPR) repeat protein
MEREEIFVGRKAELARFKEVLADPAGQAVVVTGHRGMGKTWLINKMAKMAANDGQLKCGWVRYEVTPNVVPDSTMALMMDDAYEASKSLKEGIKIHGQNKEMWKSLVSVAEVIGGTRAKALAELIIGFQREKTASTGSQFINGLRILSKRLGKNGRAIFVVDPEKYMCKESDQDWALVVKDLPDKIKLVFAQRTEDVLVKSETFGRLDNVVHIPENRLGELGEGEVEELLDLRAGEVGASQKELRAALAGYEGHPFAIQAALDLVKAGTRPAELPQDPAGIAEEQWRKVEKKGADAVCLFEAYAILEVGVPDEVVEAVSGLEPATRKSLLSDDYLGGLVRKEAGGRRIYHAILADYILGQTGEDEKTKYHRRAVNIYRKRLKASVKPDALAAMRLAEHVLEAEDKNAFVNVFINECFGPLVNLGLFDAAIAFSQRALEMVKDSSEEKAMVLGNLGLIYRTRGELDKAEEMFKRIMGIHKQLEDKEGLANDYGNLGIIEQMRGELDKAEEMYNKSLAIEKKLGRLEGMASDYGNLGLIYETRGELDKAEEMYKDSLKISEAHGLIGLSANQYGNLGNIYRTRGDLDKAEEMFRKGLKIDEKLGRLEGMASKYGNLGGLYEQRGDKKRAREFWAKSRDLYAKIGMPHMEKKVQGWLDGLSE